MAVPLLLEIAMIVPDKKPADGLVTRKGGGILAIGAGDVVVTRRIVPHDQTRAAIDALRQQKDRYSQGETVGQAMDAIRRRHG